MTSMETDVHSSPVENAVLRAMKENWDRWIKSTAPIPKLSPKYDVTITRDPPTLLYGFPVSEQCLLEYANERGMVNPRYPGRPLNTTSCRPPIIHHLRHVTGDPSLRFGTPVSDSDDLHVIMLYTNYTIEWEQYEDEDEQTIISRLKKEMDFKTEPMWYWDLANEGLF